MTRAEVYALIDGEREYQDRRWSSHHTQGHHHSPEEWVLYMLDYVNEAVHVAARTPDPFAKEQVMAVVRKVGALAVVAMEEHGAPPRNVEADVQTKRAQDSAKGYV